MSRALLVALIVAGLAVSATCPLAVQGDTLQIGQAAPAFLVATLDGESITGDFHGKPAYINVFATWCSPCRRELPAVIDKAKQYRDRIAFLFVDERESTTSVKSFASSLDGLTPVALDRGEFAASFDVGGLPWNIFIDRSGVVRFIYRGRIPADVLANQLSELLSS